ncbi:MAG: hypothetical protein ABL949_04490 [Fimbriimonadaceae bacterium]
MKNNVSSRGAAILKLLHVVGACTAISLATIGYTQMGGGTVPCSDYYSIQCASPCSPTYIRHWFDCCSSVEGGCCKRLCTASVCRGPAGNPCASETIVNEWAQGTLQQGKICDNNFCRWP